MIGWSAPRYLLPRSSGRDRSGEFFRTRDGPDDRRRNLATRLFVGGLSWDTSDESLRAFFEQVGGVQSAEVAKDRYTGRSKGFGFVEMESDSDAQKAKQELNGKELDGRSVSVDEARPPRERGAGGGGYGGGGGGRGGGGGGGGGGRRY